MFSQQVVVLGNVAVIELSDPEVENNVQQKGKAENGIVESVINGSHHILHAPVNPKNPERFDEQIQEQHQCDIFQEFFEHGIKSCKCNKGFLLTSVLNQKIEINRNWKSEEGGKIEH